MIHDGARVRNSIIRREVVIEKDVELEDCIIMDYTRIGHGARLRRVIVDRHNEIEPGDRISFDPETDRRRFHVSDSGITVVASGPKSYFARSEPGINPGS